MNNDGKNLPEFNKLVLAHLDGSKEHSCALWVRTGEAFMVRRSNSEHTVADGWSVDHYNIALERIGADFATVTKWSYVSDIVEKMQTVEPEEGGA